MKKFYLLLLACMVFFPVLAQNFQSINSSEIKLFVDADGSVRGYRIDSVQVVNGDSLLYPSRVSRTESYPECIHPFGPSMLGSYARILPGGTNLFFNANGDTIRLETQATVNQQWTMWSNDTESVAAEVVSIVEGSVFGMQDLIKQIRLSAPAFPFDGDTLLLSENFGLVQTFNFYAFPNVAADAFYDRGLKLYSLYGLGNPSLGGGNLTTFDIFDFHPGDEIHSQRKNIYFGEGFYINTSNHFTGRMDYLPDSVVYDLTQTVLKMHQSPEGDSLIYVSTSSITRTITPDSQLDALPGIPVEDTTLSGPEAPGYMYFSMYTDDPIRKRANTAQIILPTSDPDCYTPVIDNGCAPMDYTWYKGLGGPYYECGESVPEIRYNKLMYFSNDSIEWGTPLSFTASIASAKSETPFRLSPNPARDQVHLYWSSPTNGAQLEVYDGTGRLMLSNPIKGSINAIDLSGLSPGIYFVRLTLSGNSYDQKLMVQ